MNPSIYEINVRVWLRRFDTPAKRATLKDVPHSYWDALAQKGIDYVWLMGVWKTCPEIVSKYCFEPQLVESYKRTLPDWKEEDVIGSPYAVDSYTVSEDIGGEAELIDLRKELNKRKIKLVLGFIPNHFSAATSLLKSDPDIFLSAHFDSYKSEWSTFYQPPHIKEKGLYFAHGRDPYFPAWKDTVQLNFFNEKTRTFMTNTMLNIAKICDGMRCDMAMLPTNDVFEKIWGGVLSSQGFKKPETEFWVDAIKALKRKYPNCLMIAEAYWDMEWALQQMGFDYTYDKKLTDRLEIGNQFKIHGHIKAELQYQNKSVRFIENHDEERAATVFGATRGKAAAIIMSTLPGMHLYHDGQWEGAKIPQPVQLGREPKEPLDKDIRIFYEKLLSIIKDPTFKEGGWEALEAFASWGDSYNNIFAWEWKLHKERRLVVVNYSNVVSNCRLALDVKGYPDHIVFKDILNEKAYNRDTAEVDKEGLFIQLDPYQSHIFAY